MDGCGMSAGAIRAASRMRADCTGDYVRDEAEIQENRVRERGATATCDMDFVTQNPSPYQGKVEIS